MLPLSVVMLLTIVMSVSRRLVTKIVSAVALPVAAVLAETATLESLATLLFSPRALTTVTVVALSIVTSTGLARFELVLINVVGL